ncbi:hypothetical protein CL632_00750 [bacterium]|jgi:ssDNA-binding Zn-finger/Zn-ribbon topoisomerase 1|nr:hypothetical protein [bacterium]|tara:strand:- start:44212 stop:44415 length:204 start_codon:yes stop_codon:yes gene_type:complete
MAENTQIRKGEEKDWGNCPYCNAELKRRVFEKEVHYGCANKACTSGHDGFLVVRREEARIACELQIN